MAQHIAKLTHGGAEFRRGRTVQEPIAGKRHFLGEWIQIDKIAKVLLSDSRIQRGKTLQRDQIESGDYGDLQFFPKSCLVTRWRIPEGSPMEATEAAASLSQRLSKPNSSATSAARG